MYTDAELQPISALQHLLFCERQCALIHLEQQWADNDLTVEGSHLHRRVDEIDARPEVRGDLRVCRGLSLRSRRLGLIGRADVVELHRDDGGAVVAGVDGRWRPLPVEYKRGKPKRGPYDRVQLCAQALCLEEMLDTVVTEGALYYGQPKRREAVALDDDLRATTLDTIDRLHRLMAGGRTPPAVREPKCRRCSLLDICMPDALGRPSAAGYLAAAIRRAESEAAP